MSVAILLADGVEEIELISVWDILRRAEINAVGFSITGNLDVVGGQKIGLKADELLNIEKIKNNFDYLFLPGGAVGTQNLKNSKEVIELVQFFKENKKGVTAICAAPTVLEHAKIVNDLEVTSYPTCADEFKNYSNKKVVKSENIITSQGIGTSLEYALFLVEEIKSKEVAQSVGKGTLIL